MEEDANTNFIDTSLRKYRYAVCAILHLLGRRLEAEVRERTNITSGFK